MKDASALASNIRKYYLGEFFGELLFIIVAWTSYERQYLTFGQMSLLASARYALTLVMELPTGALADLFGRRRSTAFGFFLNTIGLCIIAAFPGATGLVSGVLFRAVGDSFMSGSTTALVYDSLKELGREREFPKVRANGVFTVQCSIILSSIAGGYMYDIWPGLPYVAYAVSTTIGGLLYLSMVEPSIDSESVSWSNFWKQAKLGASVLLKDSYTKQLSVYYVLVGGITWSWQVFFNQIYASSLGYSEVEKGWLFAVIRFVNAFVIIRMLHLEKFVTKRRLILFFPLLVMIAAFPSFIEWLPLNTAFLFLLTLASTLRFVVLDGYVNEQFESKYRATSLSTLNFGVGVVYICMVGVLGQVLDRYSATAALLSMGIIAAVTILPLALLLRHRHVKG